jgi:quinol-cytochrome oxidoreductase complex cytochrome b subunit
VAVSPATRERGTILAGAWHRAWGAIDERFALSSLAYPVPAHANRVGYILGGITFTGFLVLAATGIWLAQYYDPTPAAARSSVVYIMNVAPLGDVVRGVHFWTANLVMATILLHMGRVFVTGAYKRPREGNWLIGLGLLAVTLGLLFTGTVMKWDQEGYEALGHNVEVGGLLGTFGIWFSGDFAASVPLLGRLYIAHIAILPGIGTLLLIAHFLLVKHHGISALPAAADAAVDGGPAPAPGGSSFAGHLGKMIGFGLILTAVAAVVALFVVPPLGGRPIPGTETTKPPWMFLPFYPLEDWFGIAALVWAPLVLFAILGVVPFVDRGPYRAIRRRRVVVIAGAVLLAMLIGLVAYALVTPPQPHLMDAG